MDNAKGDDEQEQEANRLLRSTLLVNKNTQVRTIVYVSSALQKQVQLVTLVRELGGSPHTRSAKAAKYAIVERDSDTLPAVYQEINNANPNAIIVDQSWLFRSHHKCYILKSANYIVEKPKRKKVAYKDTKSAWTEEEDLFMAKYLYRENKHLRGAMSLKTYEEMLKKHPTFNHPPESCKQRYKTNKERFEEMTRKYEKRVRRREEKGQPLYSDQEVDEEDVEGVEEEEQRQQQPQPVARPKTKAKVKGKERVREVRQEEPQGEESAEAASEDDMPIASSSRQSRRPRRTLPTDDLDEAIAYEHPEQATSKRQARLEAEADAEIMEREEQEEATSGSEASREASHQRASSSQLPRIATMPQQSPDGTETDSEEDQLASSEETAVNPVVEEREPRTEIETAEAIVQHSTRKRKRTTESLPIDAVQPPLAKIPRLEARASAEAQPALQTSKACNTEKQAIRKKRQLFLSESPEPEVQQEWTSRNSKSADAEDELEMQALQKAEEAVSQTVKTELTSPISRASQLAPLRSPESTPETPARRVISFSTTPSRSLRSKALPTSLLDDDWTGYHLDTLFTREQVDDLIYVTSGDPDAAIELAKLLSLGQYSKLGRDQRARMLELRGLMWRPDEDELLVKQGHYEGDARFELPEELVKKRGMEQCEMRYDYLAGYAEMYGQSTLARKRFPFDG